MATVYVETFYKQPGESLDYKMDWTAWLETGDTIAGSSWAPPADITEVSSTNDASTATIVLSGGIANTHYEIPNTITTANGLIAIRTLDIRITDD